MRTGGGTVVLRRRVRRSLLLLLRSRGGGRHVSRSRVRTAPRQRSVGRGGGRRRTDAAVRCAVVAVRCGAESRRRVVVDVVVVVDGVPNGRTREYSVPAGLTAKSLITIITGRRTPLSLGRSFVDGILCVRLASCRAVLPRYRRPAVAPGNSRARVVVYRDRIVLREYRVRNTFFFFSSLPVFGARLSPPPCDSYDNIFN